MVVALSIWAGPQVADAELAVGAIDDDEAPPVQAVLVGNTMVPTEVLMMAVLLPQQFVLSNAVRQQNWLLGSPASHCSTLYTCHFCKPEYAGRDPMLALRRHFCPGGSLGG